MSDSPKGSGSGRTGSFLPYIHYCRAFAIVFIVAGHCITLPDWTAHPRTADFLSDLFADGTVVFIFLAGFLFEHLSARYSYGSYLKKKLQNVWVPYLIISIPAIIYAIYFSDLATVNPWLASRDLVHQVLWYYRTGGTHIDFPLWFVPMISVYYVAAPLFMLLVRNRKLCLLLVVPLLLLSALLHRARAPNLDTARLAAYFLGAYVLGICVSQHRARVEQLLKRAWPGLLAVFIAFVLAQFWLLPYHGNIDGRSAFSQERGLVDWMFLQKILLCFVMMGVTLRFQQRLRPVKYLGDVSFPVFLVHGYFVSWGEIAMVPRPQGSLPVFLAWVCLVLMGSIAFAYVARAVLGRHSHYLVGS